MEVMFGIIIVVLTTGLAIGFCAFIGSIILEDVDFSGMFQKWKRKRWGRKNRNKPIYERLALAHEWKAEQLLTDGRIDRARDELRSAERVRREAMDAMMNGEEPRI